MSATSSLSVKRLGMGAAVIVVIIAAAVTVFIGSSRTSAAPAQHIAAPEASGRPQSGIQEPLLYVHVSGAVKAPGIYRLRQGARVVDAVASAGGLTKKADAAGVNLARVVSDGEQLVVPEKGAAAAHAGGGPSPPAGDGRVNLNTADSAALDTLPRVGPATAERIIQWRTENGRFTSVEDLLSIPGIGQKMLESLRDLVTV